MRILVLGGNGFIGVNLVDKLVNMGHVVRVYDRSPSQIREPVKNVDYQFGGLDDEALVSQALHGVELVVHLISSTIPSTSNLSPQGDVRDNLLSAIGLLDCMRKVDVKKIIFISSGGTVYGETGEQLIKESHPLNPNCSYGIVKLAIEKYLLMYQRLYSFEPVILRVSNPYGPWQGKIGLQGLICTILSKVQRKESLDVWGDGEIIRDYVYIDDLICAFILAIENNKTGVFNVGSGSGYSINQIIKIVSEVTSKNIVVNYIEERKVDVKHVVLDITKAKEELGWQPKVDVKEGIEKYHKWIMSQ